MSVKPIPEGFHTITPYLIAEGAARVIELMKLGLGAREVHLSRMPDGTVQHGDFVIGDSHVMISEARANVKAMPCMLYLYVPDCDALYRQALAAGGKSIMEPRDMPYGDRNAAVADSAGNQWWIGTHVEDVSPEEMERRMKA